MKTKAALFSLPALAAIIPLVVPLAEARENSLSGGGSVSYEVYDRSGGNTQSTGQTGNNDNYSRVIINPVLTVTSAGDKNAVSLTYSPNMIYGNGENGQLQQAVTVNGNWSPTSRWKVAVSDSYQETDTDLDNINMARFTPPPVGGQGGQTGSGGSQGGQSGAGSSQTSQSVNNSQLSDQAGRQRYSTNLVHTEAGYEYWEDSFFKFGYEFQQLRYDQLVGSNQNYDSQTLFANINHRYNSQYRLSAQARYVQGRSDENGNASASASTSNDVDELHLSTTIESLTIPHHPLSLTYSMDSSNYDDERQANNQLHSLLLGWTWEMSEKSKLTLSAGPTLEKTDGADDSWSYALNASYSLQWSANSQISFTAGHGTEMRNFSGNQNDNGPTEYWRAGLAVSQGLTENLALNLMATAANEDVKGNTSPNGNPAGNQLAGGAHNTTQYTLGGGLNYSFARWYSLGLNYSYTTQNGNLPEDNYDEHRVMLVLSMQRDFLHW